MSDPGEPIADLHTYMVQSHRMMIGSPLTFSDGERIVAVLSSVPVAGLAAWVDVTVLVELPSGVAPTA